MCKQCLPLFYLIVSHIGSQFCLYSTTQSENWCQNLMEKPLWVKNTAYVGAYGEYWTTWAFHTATASGLLLVLIPLIATRELKSLKLSKSHWISTHCNIYMPNHINIFLGTFGIIFSSKHSRACNQSIGSSLNHLSIKIILNWILQLKWINSITMPCWMNKQEWDPN